MPKEKKPQKEPSLPTRASGPVDMFGCCSKYLSCSDAGRCLHSDPVVSKSCLYRKNLDAGQCFYGKNAAGFSPETYQELERTISILSEKELEAFLFITKTFRIMQVAQFCVYDSPELHVIADRFPYTLQDNASYILSYFRSDALFQAIPEDGGQREHCQKKMSVKKEKFAKKHPAGAFDSKQFTYAWMKKHTPEALDALCHRYRIIHLDPADRLYLFTFLAEHFPLLRYDYQPLKNCNSNFLCSDSIRVWDQAGAIRHED